MKASLVALTLMLVLMLLSLVPAVHAEDWYKYNIDTAYSGAYYGYVMVYDIDNDNNPDVVATDYYGDSVYWYNATTEPPAGAWTRYTINQTGGLDGAYGVFVYDMDGDGDPDVVASGYLAGEVVWYERPSNPATENWNNYTIGSGNGLAVVYVDDIDEDGNPDVVASAREDYEVVWYEAPDDPRETWSKHVINAVSLYGARGVCVADMDNDTDPDVVVAADIADDVVWYECPDAIQDRSGTWSKYTIDDNLNGAANIDVYNIDGTGYPDVVATGRDANVTAWYKAPANPKTDWPSGSKHVIDSSLGGAWGVHIYNIDGWSTYDIVATAIDDGDVVWYQGPEDIATNPTGWNKNPIDESADGAFVVDVYDIDNETGQGPDVVLSCTAPYGKVVWYKSDWSGLWPIPEVPLGTILLLGTGLLIPAAIAATKWLRLNHRFRR